MNPRRTTSTAMILLDGAPAAASPGAGRPTATVRSAITTNAVALLILLSSCATTDHRPTTPNRVALIMDEPGQEWLIRDDRSWSASPWSSGAVEAVQGVPEAEASARRYRTKTLLGQSFSLAAAGLAVGGLVVADFGRPVDEGDNGVALGLLGGSLVTNIAAAVLLSSGRADLLDAINRYNDAAAAREPSPATRALPVR